jgi:hypothetical protein
MAVGRSFAGGPLCEGLPTILPLQEGEGRGEGENVRSHAQPPNLETTPLLRVI